jgi:hypothetical protein
LATPHLSVKGAPKIAVSRQKISKPGLFATQHSLFASQFPEFGAKQRLLCCGAAEEGPACLGEIWLRSTKNFLARARGKNGPASQDEAAIRRARPVKRARLSGE